MKLITYKFNQENAWNFQELKLKKQNLIVGRTGSGKSRFLNTILSFSYMFYRSVNDFKSGTWELEFKLDENEADNYFYSIEIRDKVLLSESLKRGETSLLVNDGTSITIGEKHIEGFSPEIFGLKAFQNHENFRDIVEAFRSIFIRRHSPGEGKKTLGVIPRSELNKIIDEKSFADTLLSSDSVNPEMGFYYLSQFKQEILDEFKECFTSMFEGVQDLDLKNVSDFPSIKVQGISEVDLFVLAIKENNQWIPKVELSSGMNRFLEALVDIYVPPSNSIIIYDEFENGLDPLIIEDLMELFIEKASGRQYIFTSHHPYIIDKICTSIVFA